MTTKASNPKDALGIAKVPASTIPTQVLGEVGLAMLEGALKYGRHNYRVAGVRASVYYDAVVARHLAAWWEGEDIDPESGLSHVTKAIAGLVVLRDSMLQGNWVDDRPPKAADPEWIQKLNEKVAELLAKYPEPKPANTELSCRQQEDSEMEQILYDDAEMERILNEPDFRREGPCRRLPNCKGICPCASYERLTSPGE